MLGQKDSAEAYMQRILDKYPTEGNYYDAACLMSRMGEYQRSIEYLKVSFEKGYHEINHLDMEHIWYSVILYLKCSYLLRKAGDDNVVSCLFAIIKLSFTSNLIRICTN